MNSSQPAVMSKEPQPLLLRFWFCPEATGAWGQVEQRITPHQLAALLADPACLAQYLRARGLVALVGVWVGAEPTGGHASAGRLEAL